MSAQRRAGVLVLVVVASGLATLVLQEGCMLITSPGDFTIVGEGGAPHPDGGRVDADVCSNAMNPTPCTTCLSTKCCNVFSACQASAACVALSDCATGDTSCEKDNTGGADDLKVLTACAERDCVICSESGIGDPCGSSGATCGPGLTCTGLWCTKSCAGDPDCAGAFQSGENGSGGQNRCALNAENAAVCFPGCATVSDCSAFPGTSCAEATAPDGDATNVCSATDEDDGGGPEAGAFDAASFDATTFDAAIFDTGASEAGRSDAASDGG
jgi:hypothetical protein